MKQWTAGVALACALTSCGQSAVERPTAPAPQTEAAPGIPTDPAAGPSGGDNMTWQFTEAGRAGAALPRLMYASYGSEGMALNLQCDGEITHARLWRGQQRDLWPFSLRSGTARADLTGTTAGDSEVVVNAALQTDAPVLRSFRETGRISVIDGDTVQVLDAINDAERQTIAAFFRACTGSRPGLAPRAEAP